MNNFFVLCTARFAATLSSAPFSLLRKLNSIFVIFANMFHKFIYTETENGNGDHLIFRMKRCVKIRCKYAHRLCERRKMQFYLLLFAIPVRPCRSAMTMLTSCSSILFYRNRNLEILIKKLFHIFWIYFPLILVEGQWRDFFLTNTWMATVIFNCSMEIETSLKYPKMNGI